MDGCFVQWFLKCQFRDTFSLVIVCVCIFNFSIDWSGITVEGGVALGEALIVNQTLQTLRYMNL